MKTLLFFVFTTFLFSQDLLQDGNFVFTGTFSTQHGEKQECVGVFLGNNSAFSGIIILEKMPENVIAIKGNTDFFYGKSLHNGYNYSFEKEMLSENTFLCSFQNKSEGQSGWVKLQRASMEEYWETLVPFIKEPNVKQLEKNVKYQGIYTKGKYNEAGVLVITDELLFVTVNYASYSCMEPEMNFILRCQDNTCVPLQVWSSAMEDVFSEEYPCSLSVLFDEVEGQEILGIKETCKELWHGAACAMDGVYKKKK